jgi:hypothetical protein
VIEAYTDADASWGSVLKLPADELGYGEAVLPSVGRSKWRLHCGVSDYSREVMTPS